MDRINPGIRISGIRPEMALAVSILIPLCNVHKADLVITSISGGKHMAQSLHYVGQAMDIRSADLLDVDHFVEQAKTALGGSYDVVKEEDHIHVEFQPKFAY